MSLRTLAASGALLIALAVPTAARAQATIDPLAKSCYVTAGTVSDPEGEGIVIAARGFAANSLVDLAFDGEVVPNGSGLQTDANGEIGVLSPLVVPAPFIPSGSGSFTITLTQQDNPANVATATARHTALGVSVKPQTARPSSRIRFKGSGFTLDKPVYAHYVFGGELRKTVKMSGDPGACGQWRKRARQIPVRNPETGIWKVQFDQLKRYRKPSAEFPSVYVQLRIQVSRIFD
jgi:hypothetical protein